MSEERGEYRTERDDKAVEMVRHIRHSYKAISMLGNRIALKGRKLSVIGDDEFQGADLTELRELLVIDEMQEDAYCITVMCGQLEVALQALVSSDHQPDSQGQCEMPREDALEDLHDAGAHFVLCDRGTKQPVGGQSWLQNRPSKETVLGWGGNLGIIPQSLGLSVLDIDDNAPGAVTIANALPPLLSVESRTAGYNHLWYPDPNGHRPESRFTVVGVEMELKSSRSYVMLWRDTPQRLARALRYVRDARGNYPSSNAKLEDVLGFKAVPLASDEPGGATNE